MLNVIDTATTQRNMDFAQARRQGWVSAYVKMGGDNVGRYIAPHYVSEVDRARAAGMRVGHYWVPNADYNPEDAADYFVNNLRGWTARDYVVLDNESLDGARHYTDAQAARWIERVKARLKIPGKQVKHYSGLADARSTGWTRVLATGANFIIAAYSYGPFQFPTPSTIPANRIDGHQWISSGTVGGVHPVDLNAFKDNAFTYSTTASTGGTLAPATKETEVTAYVRFQNTRPGPVTKTWQRQAVDEGGKSTNLAGGTGGRGLYELTLNFYFADFAEDAQVEAKLVLDPTRDDASNGYSFFIDGSNSRQVRIALPATVNITEAATLHLELRQTRGTSAPVLKLWGADVKNFGKVD